MLQDSTAIRLKEDNFDCYLGVGLAIGRYCRSVYYKYFM